MAVLSPAQIFSVQTGIYDTKKFIDEENYYTQRNSNVSMLTNKMIYMMGMSMRSLPLATRLFGSGYFDTSGMAKIDDENPFALNAAVKTVDTTEYTYPVMVNAKKGAEIAKNGFQAGDKPGIGGLAFEVPFKTNALHKNFVIRSPRGTLLYVTKEPEHRGNLWYYSLSFTGGSQLQYLDVAELQEGTTWINMFPLVAESESRDINIGRAITPSFYKNQINTMRLGLSWGGDAANFKSKVVVFTDKKMDNNGQVQFDRDDKNVVKKTWIDQYLYNYEVDCTEYLESAFWYAEYNKAINGTIGLKDTFTGKTISMGSGILQQILNKVSYTNFSYELLNDVLGRAYYGIKGTPKTKTLYTGTLGFRKFDAAMKAKAINFLTDFGLVSNLFVTGNDRNLMLGGYFDGFYHIDGWIIKVKKVDIFDNGLISNSPLDEESGLPYESARMVLLDDSEVEGEQNLQLLVHKDYMPYQHAIRQGMTNVPASMELLFSKHKLDNGAIPLVSDDMDKASYMRKYRAGVQLLRGNTSIDFQYNPAIW